MGKSKKMTKKATKKTTKKATKKITKQSNPLSQAKSLLQKALKSTDWHTDLDPKSARKSLETFSTGSIVINHLIGGKPNDRGIPPCPGVPKGRILNLYGHESSGKTTIALQTSVETIKAGGTVCYIDWEHEIVPDYAMELGIPIGDETKFMLCQPDTLDDGVAILWTMASAGVSLIVLDSVGAGVPKAYFNKPIAETAEQARLGLNAAVWSQFLPKLKGRIATTKTAVLGISQTRAAINTTGYGETITVQGGWAWKFYSAVRMKLKKIATEKASEYSPLTNKHDNRVVGAKIRVKLDKCKVSRQQGNEEDVYIRWGYGVDDLRSLIEIGVAHRLVRKDGSWFTWVTPDGEEIRYQGMENFRGFFVERAEIRKTLERQVRPYMTVRSSDHEDIMDEEEVFVGGSDLKTNDAEIQDILASISTEAPPEEPK